MSRDAYPMFKVFPVILGQALGVLWFDSFIYLLEDL